MILSLMQSELRRDEGVRYEPYSDTEDHRTIGVGHNMDASPIPAGWTYPLNDIQVTQLLNHDITVAMAALDLHLPWWRTLDEVRQRCLCNICFNIGIGGLLGFHNALADLQAGYFLSASQDFQESEWYRQVGARAVRICAGIKNGAIES